MDPVTPGASAAERAGFSEDRVKRARQSSGIRSVRSEDRWYWATDAQIEAQMTPVHPPLDNIVAFPAPTAEDRAARKAEQDAERESRRPMAQQFIAAPPLARGYRSSFPLACAANCRARCCRTLALATLTPIAVAESLIEHPSKNRSSRIRR